MQSKEELEAHYATGRDPWKYCTRPEDQKRKSYIVGIAKTVCPKYHYHRALDVAAGEGWITKDLPASEIFGYDISDIAMDRFPQNVLKLDDRSPDKFDLVIATGCLYPHYDCSSMLDMIKKYANGIVLTCNVAAWETTKVQEIGHQIFEATFPYTVDGKDLTQRLRVFER